jgi:hypothetical protein
MKVNKSYQSIKISNETSNFKIIPDLIELIKDIDKKFNFSKDDDIIISVKYGKRIVINCEKLNLKKLDQDDFLEIVDFNPIKKLFLFIGKQNPDFNMTIHWIIQNARREINILIQLKSDIINKLVNKKNYFEDKKYKENSIEISKDILYKLRSKNIVFNKEFGVFVIGNNLDEIKNILYNLNEGI